MRSAQVLNVLLKCFGGLTPLRAAPRRECGCAKIELVVFRRFGGILDRLLNDFTALRGGEPRLRQPSREVYGRMDLEISSADERGEPQGEVPLSEAPQRPHTARFQRPGENLPKGPPIDPAVVFKGGIILVFALLLLIVFWIIKSLAGSGTAPVTTRSAAPAASEPAEAMAAAPAATVSIVALESVRIKVVRKMDGVELFQGPLQAGERRDYPNVPIYLTASDLAAVEIEGEYGTHKQHRQTGPPKTLLYIREEHKQQQQKKRNVNAEFYAEQPACVYRPFHKATVSIETKFICYTYDCHNEC